MLALFVALATAAAAPAERIALWPTVLAGPHGDLKETELRADLASIILARPTLDLLPETATIQREKVLACGSEATCLAKLVTDAGADIGLRVAVDLRFDPPVYSLQLLRENGASLANAFGEERVEGQLRAEIQQRTTQLFDEAGHQAMALLRIAVTPPDAKVTIAPEAGRDRGDGLYTVPAGQYQIRAEQEGHLAAEALIDAAAGRASTVTLSLAPEADSSFPWLWAGITVAAAIGAGVAIGLIASRGGERCICITSGEPCPSCDP